MTKKSGQPADKAARHLSTEDRKLFWCANDGLRIRRYKILMQNYFDKNKSYVKDEE